MSLFTLTLAADGSVASKERVELADITPAMLAPFLGPFAGGSGEAEIPVAGGDPVVLSWTTESDGTARGSFHLGDTLALESVLAAGADAAADLELLTAAGREWGEGLDASIYGELAAIDQRPLLISQQTGAAELPPELSGADVLLAALSLQARGGGA